MRGKRAQSLEDKKVIDSIKAAEDLLKGTGRVLVRPSGTEPMIRVMAEGDDAARVAEAVDMICAALEASHGVAA
jgi:phosphoglucosamine mutase